MKRIKNHNQYLVVDIIRFNQKQHKALLPAITEVLHDSYRPLLKKGMKYLASHQSNEVTLKRLTEGHGFLAFLSNELVGTISLIKEDPHTPSQWYQRPEVFFFGSLPLLSQNFKERGIGTKLMNYIESFASKKGGTEIAMDTSEKAKDLIYLYKKRDYRFIEFVNWSETNYKSVIMSKSL